MSVLVCVPTARDVHGLTMAAVFRLCSSHPGGCGFHTVQAVPVDRSRNLCVEVFLRGPHTHLFFVDSDVVPPDDALDRLLAANAPVACGIYPLALEHQGLVASVAERHDDGVYEFLADPPDEPFEADAAGLGCCLIHRRVLEDIDRPWFRFVLDADGGQVGEDMDFFQRTAAQLDVRPLVVPDVLCQHHRVADLLGPWLDARHALRAEMGIPTAPA